MTAQIFNMVERLDRKNTAPPKRAPDFSFDGWLRGGEVEWVSLTGDYEKLLPPDDLDSEISMMLRDALWIYASQPSKPARDRMALLIFITHGGFHHRTWSKTLFEGTNWRHSLWMLRQGYRTFGMFIHYAWRAGIAGLARKEESCD